MTESKASKTTTQVRAGVSAEEEKIVREEAKDTFDQEVEAEVTTDLPPFEGLLKELPDNGAVMTREGSGVDASGEVYITPTILRVGEATAPTFADEFHGVGGSYVIDPKTGDRKRQYEEVFSEKGKSLGFRPAP